MFNKKGATTADILSFFIILLGGSIFIMGIALFVIAPAMGERGEISVKESISEFNDNIFLFNYLRYPVEGKTIADLVVQDYAEHNYELLERETINFLTKLYAQENVKWRIYVNDELVIDNTQIFDREKTIHETYIPNYYGLDPIKFKFAFY